MPWQPFEPGLVVVANGSASGIEHSRDALERARQALRRSGARLETHLTESVVELAATWPDIQDRRVVLLSSPVV